MSAWDIWLQIGEVLGQAEAVSSQLSLQRQLFLGMGGKMQALTNRFPALNGVMTAIRRKKSKVRRCCSHDLWRVEH